MVRKPLERGRLVEAILSNVSRETIDLCRRLETDVRRWQRTTNLIANSTINDIWHRHILDSLQLVPFIPVGSRVVDIGSGGGFPALPLAIWQSVEGGGDVTAIESNRKKTSFLRQTAHQLNLSLALNVSSNRIEAVNAAQYPADIFTARALASLDKLLAYAAPWVEYNPALRCLFHKGREYEAELAACRGDWQFDLIEHVSVTSPDARILEITNLQRKSDLS